MQRWRRYAEPLKVSPGRSKERLLADQVHYNPRASHLPAASLRGCDLRSFSCGKGPGEENSLGLVKFELPNPYDVYLHGTPARELFSKSRRDFSHGCVRVENPVALAVWLLRENPGWNEERIDAAMHGNETLRIVLANPVPVWIVYGTAVVLEDGRVRFFKDVYGQDAVLEQELARERAAASVRDQNSLPSSLIP